MVTPKYSLYYDPEFLLERDNITYKHNSGDPAREARVRLRVDSIKASLPTDGMRNPVIIYMERDGTFKLHPGKCRVTAALELGWKTVPALIIDKHSQYPSHEPGTYITPSDAGALFSDDQYVKYTDDLFGARLCNHKFKGEADYPGEVVQHAGGTPPNQCQPKGRTV